MAYGTIALPLLLVAGVNGHGWLTFPSSRNYNSVGETYQGELFTEQAAKSLLSHVAHELDTIDYALEWPQYNPAFHPGKTHALSPCGEVRLASPRLVSSHSLECVLWVFMCTACPLSSYTSYQCFFCVQFKGRQQFEEGTEGLVHDFRNDKREVPEDSVFYAGGFVDFEYEIFGNHMGVISYRICTEEDETEACFQRNTLTSTTHPEDPDSLSWFPIKPAYETKNYFVATDRVWIPVNLTCDRCTLSWRWDCRDQTEIWTNCADITILPQRVVDDEGTDETSMTWASPMTITILGAVCSLLLVAGFIVKKRVRFAASPIILNPDDDPDCPDMRTDMSASLLGALPPTKASSLPSQRGGRHQSVSTSSASSVFCFGFPMSMLETCGGGGGCTKFDPRDDRNSCGIMHTQESGDFTSWNSTEDAPGEPRCASNRVLNDVDDELRRSRSGNSSMKTVPSFDIGSGSDDDEAMAAMSKSSRDVVSGTMTTSKSGLDLASGMVDSFRERCSSQSSDLSASGDLLGDDALTFGDDAGGVVVVRIHNEASGPLAPVAEEEPCFSASLSCPDSTHMWARGSCQKGMIYFTNTCMAPPVVLEDDGRKSVRQDMQFEWLSNSYFIDFSSLHIGRRIGYGGGGQVYQGRFCESEVAVKLLNTSRQDFGLFKEAERELRFLSTLHCPQIVQFIGVCINVGDIYFVTELCEKGSMLTLIENATSDIPIDFCLQLLSDVSKGMAYLHNQSPAVIHRDLKPGNVLLDNSFRAKICDFGLTRIRDPKRRMTSRVGTGYYCAPEVFIGECDDSPYTEKMDIYSFAMVMYTLFEREEPFYDTNSKKEGILVIYQKICDGIRPNRPKSCPQPFGEIMERCWHKNPTDRPSFPQILEMLRAIKV
jgi:hypothetical protein